ncbi:MAG TPA: OsmC family protein [Candidatus Thermoplasmatota archaeon]|nr:OsmC family protein [Candidatus Thermoplasmatota archaeon]
MANAKGQSEVAEGVLNGIELKALNGVIDAVKQQPQVARATFGVEAETRSGFQTRSRTAKPTLGGAALAGRTHTFEFVGDHPPELLGKDEAPAAVESLLGALAACVSGGFTMYGAALGIPVESVKVELTGAIDLQGMMMLPAPGVVRPGFERIHAKIRVKSPAARADLEKLKDIAESTSPVKDSLRAVPYTSELLSEA